MKTRVNHFSRALAIITLFTAVHVVTAQDGEEQVKKYHQEYLAGKSTHLSIQNKYGNITIKNWDKNDIVIDVIITLDMRDKEKAEKYLNYVSVEFSQEGDNIFAETKIDEKFNNPGNFFTFGEDKKFSIDYTVSIPTNLQLSILNKYGNVGINELSGQINLEVKYGNLKINKLTRNDTKPLSEVSLAYSNGSIEECNWLKVDLRYSKIEINKSKALVIVSKYSKVNIEEASSIVSEAKYDQYELGKLTNFVGQGGYTNYRIQEVGKKLQLDIKYGDCKVKYIPPTFENVKIESAYAGIKLGIDPSASYKLDGKADYAKIFYPEDSPKLSRISENTSLSVNGIIGKDSNPKAFVYIDTDFGNVSLTSSDQ